MNITTIVAICLFVVYMLHLSVCCILLSLAQVAGIMVLTAEQLDARHGAELAAPPWVQCQSPRQLWTAPKSRKHRLAITEGVLKQWFAKYRPRRVQPEAAEASRWTAKALESSYGSELRALAQTTKTAYLLRKALLERDAPMAVTEGVLKQWLKLYVSSDQVVVHSAAALELRYGAEIRGRDDMRGRPWRFGMAQRFALKANLAAKPNVFATVPVCHAWLSRDWLKTGQFCTRMDVEDALCERFRLATHRQGVADEAAAELLSQSLAEEQPPVHITGILLLEWYARYYPDAGTLRADTAQELERCLGPELREPPYAGLQACL